jgi:NADH:ubiquinone oxidoreductase subunit 3 (subunit A)
MMQILLSPPAAFIIFCLILAVVNRFLQRHAAVGPDHPDKHLPYSGGQMLPPEEVRLSYKRFFRLALLFGVAHVAVLVLATLPQARGAIWLGLFYLIGLSVSAFALGRIKKN